MTPPCCRISPPWALENRGVDVEAVALDVGSPEAVKRAAGRPRRRRWQAADPRRDPRGWRHEGQLLTGTRGRSVADHDASAEDRRLPGSRTRHSHRPPVDFFFFTSAVGAVFGVPGGAPTHRANAYLDGLARARHRAGCRSLSLNWVVWRGLGFATEAQVVLSTSWNGWVRGRSPAGGVPPPGSTSTPSIWRRR